MPRRRATCPHIHRILVRTRVARPANYDDTHPPALHYYTFRVGGSFEMATVCRFHIAAPRTASQRGRNEAGGRETLMTAREAHRQQGGRHRRRDGVVIDTALHVTRGGDEYASSFEATASDSDSFASSSSSGSGRRSILAGFASCVAMSLGVEQGSVTTFSGRGGGESGLVVLDGTQSRLTLNPPAAHAADVASFVSLDALVAQVRAASSELTLIQEALSTSVALGTEPPLKELKKRLSTGAVAELPEAAVRLDRFIDNAPLEDWEDAVWSSVSEEVRGSKEIDSVTGTRLPGVDRTNDFLCLVFSCFNGEAMTRL